jgi:hypothetical protein
MKEGVIGEAFTALAEAMARQVAIRNATFAQTQRVELKV